MYRMPSSCLLADLFALNGPQWNPLGLKYGEHGLSPPQSSQPLPFSPSFRLTAASYTNPSFPSWRWKHSSNRLGSRFQKCGWAVRTEEPTAKQFWGVGQGMTGCAPNNLNVCYAWWELNLASVLLSITYTSWLWPETRAFFFLGDSLLPLILWLYVTHGMVERLINVLIYIKVINVLNSWV